jgi:tRNA A-37 threonylcarbamoyl transferase component Bud32
VWKDFRSDHRSLRREAAALRRLEQEAAPAPRLLRRQGSVLLKTYVEGPTLRDRLVQAGAAIRLSETEADPELAQLTHHQRIARVWDRGRAAMRSLDPELANRIAARLDEMHRAGVTGPSLTFGNIVLAHGNEPFFIDFDRARVADRRGLHFALARDRDRQLANEIYGLSLLTEHDALGLLESVGSSNYSPVDLGQGLVTRGFWSIDSGSGRWEFLNRRVLRPLLPGARVLDLGSHNCLMPLMMLRDGAESVVAVERDPSLVHHAQLLHRLFQWREARPLALEVLNLDMLTAALRAEGPFDIVTSLCSLYYLEPEDMVAVVRRAAELSPVMVLQAKTDTRVDAPDNKAAKSQVPFLREILVANGFPHVTLHAPQHFSRPLLVGSRTSAPHAG